ncbi:UDP-N-acetylmuramoyl-L-alanine--D-glutamate ligase [Thermospira aquatica]|uniref:UDP-N-acetylmuramoylalanine--D-glutamate ligase n=1 Tax=Thermospira aquatica TaxID=2828656 RepID=A0AAX3BA25_9SPIR|nr:UDP-N-acetylmuramoyl-L-alanine--D-glutamate ligase [Thermospira aquatica]URA09103.1 UDP-N-acetylmuramoyl-L-alanine--D-glutamate ligase [Thermospira aquatica]
MRYLLIGWTRRTSFETAKVLLAREAEVYVSDTVDNEEKQALLRELNHPRLFSLLGRQSKDILDEVQPDVVMPSPGVPLTIPLIEEAKKRGIPVFGDIELFYRFHPEVYYYAITGTDGKTTTTTLSHALISAYKPALVGGNIGTAIFEHEAAVASVKEMVLELSSFQLEEIVNFRPRIAAFLNLAEDHLDRYPDLDAYFEAKKRIFLNQTPDDVAIVNADSPYFEQVTAGVKSRILTFSRKSRADMMFYDGGIYYGEKLLVKQEELKLKGVHNIENVMAASLVALMAGVPMEVIQNTLREFRGLEHRLELVGSYNGVEVYNDSKATTVNALEKALESFDVPVILIAGGLDKGLDFTLVKGLVYKKVKTVILLGQAAEKIDSAWQFPHTTKVPSLEVAVETAFSHAKPGEVILFSPGCASFDMFKNYEERGRAFKAFVQKRQG